MKKGKPVELISFPFLGFSLVSNILCLVSLLDLSLFNQPFSNLYRI